MQIFTGIGSRETPRDVQTVMAELASFLGQKKFVLRSGGADGADMAFELGCDRVSGGKEIYLPWKGFNNNPSQFYEIPPYAFELASEIHSGWDYLSLAAKKLHARNCMQVLGAELDTPSDFLICWTKNGKPIGGTATAINLAKKWEISVYNLFNKEDRESLDKLFLTL